MPHKDLNVGIVDDDVESGLSEISNEVLYFSSKVTYQRRALFNKNWILQRRSKCTNILQMFVPIVSLLLVWLIGLTSEERWTNFVDVEVFVPVPYIFGLEYKTIKNLGGEPIMIDNCDKWFFYEFESNATKATQEYWGFNDGRPWGG